MNDYFTCHNGQNISWTLVCDNHQHCQDGSDEIDCYCQGDTYSCLRGNNVSCRIACTTYGHVTCLTYQNRKACEFYIDEKINKGHIHIFQCFIFLIISVLILTFILTIFFFFIRKYSIVLFNRSLNRKSMKENISSLSQSRLRYVSAPTVDDFYLTSDKKNQYDEPSIYPDSLSLTSIYRSDSIYYESIKTPSITNSMSKLEPMILPEPNQFPVIRTYCV